MNPVALPKRDFYRLDEVALYLNVSRSTLYRWIEYGMPGGGNLEVVKIGSGLRITRESVEKIPKKMT